LRELQTAQASLVHAQKMAALGQLTADIAHKIKNPLNFINNFSALSVELIDELLSARPFSIVAGIAQSMRHFRSIVMRARTRTRPSFYMIV
jgi:C4-dicarboxylate-specific signal transduction histidine kinase